VVLGQQCDQLRQVGRIAVAIHVGFGEADVAVEQDAAKEAPALDVQRRLSLGVGGAESATGAVGQPQGQATDGKAVERLQGEVGGEGRQRVTNSGSGAGLRQNLTRFRHSCKACQWMRAIAATLANTRWKPSVHENASQVLVRSCRSAAHEVAVYEPLRSSAMAGKRHDLGQTGALRISRDCRSAVMLTRPVSTVR
jgi:hypothetical protein